MNLRTYIPTLVLSITMLSSISAMEMPAEMDAFFNQHCFECHDPDVKKGGLDLWNLAFEPEKTSNFKVWQHVLERVRDGEMPPKEEPQPKAAEIAKFVAALEKPLLAMDKELIAKEGRVQTRRLTRREYEYTMHDLLGIDLPLQNQLPADPSVHGFETVADSQQLSHHHLARYLDVADQALAHAFDRALNGDKTFKKFHTPADLAKQTRGNYRGPELRDGKSISWPIRLQFFGRMPVTTIPQDGWYRVTVKGVEAINPGKDGAVWGTLRSGACYSNAPVLYMVGVIEATKKPRDIVYEAWIQRGHMLELRPNDFTQKSAPTGATGGNVSFKGRDLAKSGHSGIAHKGILVERIYPNANAELVQRRLFGKEGLDHWKGKPKAAIETLVGQFARRAFRQPVPNSQLAPYRDLGLTALADGASLSEALHASYRAILCSPRFLTFIEKPGKLDDYAVASRLSYALWNSMPDWDLIKLANEGKLTEPSNLSAQIDRMLKSPKSERFVESFTDQWLKLKEIDFTSPDRRQFPDFDPVLQEAMVMETRAYFRDMIQRNLSVTNFVDSDHAWLNGRLARHYGETVDLKPGEGIQRVSLSNEERTSVRGGFVTQGAVLKVTADGTVTSPVIRGVFLNERVLGVHIPPPPPNVPAIEPDIRGAVSIRDQLDKHRSNPSCFSCHLKIDPPGFALENFDPVGGWRSNYGIRGKGQKVNPSGVTKDGEAFAGLMQWKKLYVKKEEQLAKGFTRQFLTYSTGAPTRFSEEDVIYAIATQAGKNGYGLRSIIEASLTSRTFLHK